jgi:hypothetical protein
MTLILGAKQNSCLMFLTPAQLLFCFLSFETCKQAAASLVKKLHAIRAYPRKLLPIIHTHFRYYLILRRFRYIRDVPSFRHLVKSE